VLIDMDTPEDYRRIAASLAGPILANP